MTCAQFRLKCQDPLITEARQGARDSPLTTLSIQRFHQMKQVRFQSARQPAEKNPCLRGGGSEGTKTDVGGARIADPSASTLEIKHLSQYMTLLSQISICGVLDGEPCTAAYTKGDGACGLHALFGEPLNYRLEAVNVRNRIGEALPTTLLSACEGLRSEAPDVLFPMLESIWAEGKNAAKRILAQQE